jgi:hypothetical protein
LGSGTASDKSRSLNRVEIRIIARP